MGIIFSRQRQGRKATSRADANRRARFEHEATAIAQSVPRDQKKEKNMRKKERKGKGKEEEEVKVPLERVKRWPSFVIDKDEAGPSRQEEGDHSQDAIV